MPLTPARRREAREQQRMLADPRPMKRAHCRNCDKRIEINPRYPWKKFCSDECRKEFDRHGSAFGPLKVILEKLVRKWFKEIAEDRVAALEKRVAELEAAQRLG